MTWQQNVPIRPWVVDEPGYCLRYTQAFFGAPEMHPSAWVAWQNQKYRHGPSEPLPPVPCVLWFSHYGTYGRPPSYGNWGHVVAHVPGDAIYSSPTHGGASFMRYANIQQIEAAYNCSYVGWSEDLNGLRICQYVEDTPSTPSEPPKRKKTKDMIGIRVNDGNGEYGAPGKWYFAVYTGTTFVEVDKEDADAISVHMGESFANVTYHAWETFKTVANKTGIAS